MDLSRKTAFWMGTLIKAARCSTAEVSSEDEDDSEGGSVVDSEDAEEEGSEEEDMEDEEEGLSWDELEKEAAR